jgi:hypothetical protein
MRSRVKIGKPMQREGLSGEVVTLFHSRSTGVIHGDDGNDVTFNEESLVVGLAYSEIGIGLRVSYGIFFATGAKVPTAINVQPASGGRTEATQDSESTFLQEQVGSAWCSSASGRVGWGAPWLRIAQSCSKTKEPSLTKERDLVLAFGNEQESEA